MSNKIKIIIIITLSILLLIGYLVMERAPTPSTNPSNPSISFFPTEVVKRVVNTISNTITSNPIIEIITENSNSTTTSTINNSKAIKIADGPIQEFGFTNKTGSTTLFYLVKGTGELKFIPVDATSTMVLASTTEWLVYSPNKEEMIKFNTNEGNLKGELTNLKTKITTSLLISPLTSWIITWPEATILGLQSKPSSGMEGYFYTFNLKTRLFKHILGPLPGLNSLLSPDGKNIIYSTNQNGEIKTYIKSIISQNSNELGIRTLIDKCVWYDNTYVVCAVPLDIISNIFPDNWYQGINSFRDDIWIINSKKYQSYLINTFGEPLGDEPIDVIKLQISPDKKDIYFINKLDSSLWKFNLSGFEF